MKVELVGSEKIRKRQELHKLLDVALKGMPISTMGSQQEIAETCPQLTDLDLQKTLLTDWCDIANGVSQLPVLHTLNLSRNLFKPVAPALFSEHDGAFAFLKVLVLNETKMPWSEIRSLARALSALEELHIRGNNYQSFRDGDETDTLPFFPGTLGKLKVINLQENMISSWESVLQLIDCLPSLENAMLSFNPLPDLPLATGKVYPKVTSLSLSHADVKDWASVEAMIAIFPHVDSLRLHDNPLMLKMGPAQARQELIVRVPKLSCLNGSELRARERVDTERMYLSRCMKTAMVAVGATTRDEWEKLPLETKDKALSTYPRFNELVAIHGLPVAAKSALTGSTLSSNSVTVSFKSMAAASMTLPQKEKKLPLSTTVYNCKQMCQKLFSVDVENQTLMYMAPGSGDMPQELDDDTRAISWYGVADGGVVMMQDKTDYIKVKKS